MKIFKTILSTALAVGVMISSCVMGYGQKDELVPKEVGTTTPQIEQTTTQNEEQTQDSELTVVSETISSPSSEPTTKLKTGPATKKVEPTTKKPEPTTKSRLDLFLANKPVNVEVKYQNDEAIQKAVFNTMNEHRKAAGIKPLKYYENADGIALLRANELVNCPSHTRPDGTKCNAILKDNGWHCSIAAENIAARFTEIPKMTDGWMNSPSHRDAVLNPNYEYTCVSVIKADDGKYYSVQLFFKP